MKRQFLPLYPRRECNSMYDVIGDADTFSLVRGVVLVENDTAVIGEID